MNHADQGASDCLMWQGRRVKGKQVRSLCDLVTVTEESDGVAGSSHWGNPGRQPSDDDPQARKPALYPGT